MFGSFKRGSLVAALAASMTLATGAAHALETVKIGKAVPNSFAFSTCEIGIDAGIWAKEGIDLKVSAFRGDAKLQQAMTAGAIDLALGSGPGMGFRAKGVPAIAVAAMYGAPQNLALFVGSKTGIKTVADLKGKRVGVTTLGSLTDWLTRKLSAKQGWGSDGIKVMPLGAAPARLAAIERGELDGMVVEAATAISLEEQGKGHLLMQFGDIEKHFYTHVIFATDNMINNRPDVLRHFLRGWFETIAFMRKNKAATVKTAAKVVKVSEKIASKVYDAEIGGFSSDGAWDKQSIDVIRRSLKDLHILSSVPDAKTIYNDKFVPVKF